MDNMPGPVTDCLQEAALHQVRRVAFLEARGRGLSHHDAEDVAGDIVTDMLLRLRSGTDTRNPGGWARVATRRHLTDLTRHRTRHKRNEDITCSLEDFLAEEEK